MYKLDHINGTWAKTTDTPSKKYKNFLLGNKVKYVTLYVMRGNKTKTIKRELYSDVAWILSPIKSDIDNTTISYCLVWRC